MASRDLTIPLIIALIAGCSNGETGDESQPGRDLVSVLEGDGFSVGRGESTPFFIADCANLPSCYGANATSPYGLWNLPPGPGEPPLGNGFDVPRTPPGMAPAWRLREDEAVVYIGRTPPAAAYFSYAPYVFERTNPASGARATVFASIADSLNVANLRTAGDSRFDAETAIVLTADRTLEATLRQRLIESGVAEASINTLVVPASDLRLGFDEEADALMMLQRFAIFEDEQAGKSYLEKLPVTLLRVTPTEPRAIDALPVPARAERATGNAEQSLTAGLDALEAAVRAQHPGTVEPVAIIAASVVAGALDPMKCAANYSNCLAK